MLDSISYIGLIHSNISIPLPLAPSKVQCGFPSAAEDWLEDKLDLNEKLIKSPPSTFLILPLNPSRKNSKYGVRLSLLSLSFKSCLH
jgi:DNA polymerase V